MSFSCVSPRVLALSLLVGALSVPAGQVRKLNAPLPVELGGEVGTFLAIPDGSRVVYSGELQGSGASILSAFADGSQIALPLGPDLTNVGLYRLRLSPDGTQVVYVADQDAYDVFELYAVPADGSAPPVRLNAPFVAGGDVRAQQILGREGLGLWISPDSTRVVYVADALADQVNELFSVPLDGSAPPVRISGPMAAGGDVWSEGDSSGGLVGVAISPDSQWVVYVADQDTNDVRELYRAPLDGSAAPVRLNAPLVAGRMVVPDFALSSDGTRVVYRADQDTNDVFELYSVASDGSAVPVRLNTPPVAGGNVISAQVSPDGTRVVYYGDQDVNDIGHVYSVPIDGSAAPTRLSGPYVSGGGGVAGLQPTPRFAISPDGARVVYIVDEDVASRLEIYGVPIDGSAPSVRLNGPAILGGHVSRFRFSPDGSRVVYQGILDSPGLFELYSAPTDASAPEVKLSGADGAWFDYVVGAERVAFTIEQPASEPRLHWSVPIDGSGPAEALPTGIIDRKTSPDGLDLLYTLRTGSLKDLYRVPLDLSAPEQRLNAPIAPDHGAITAHQHSPDGEWVVYHAEQEELGSVHLFAAPAGGTAAPRRLGAPLSGNGVSTARVRPDSRQVGYIAAEDVPGKLELYVTSLDVAGPSVKRSGPLLAGGRVFDFAYTDDGAGLVYKADPGFNGKTDLFSVPSDGGQTPVNLSSVVAFGGDVFQFELTPDSDRVVFTGDVEVDGQIELYGSTLGAPARVDLSGGLVAGGDVFAFLLTPDSARAVFGADKETDGKVELYATLVDGSALPVKLSGPMIALGDVQDSALSPDGTTLVFLADRDADETVELYGVPVDGSAPTVKLSPPLVAGGDVTEFAIAPDSSRVAFCADASLDGALELYSVPLGGGAVSPLSGPSGSPGAQRVAISADSTRAVYVVGGGALELHSVPLDGSTPPVRLDGPVTPGGSLSPTAAFALHPDSARVFYLADHRVDERFELFEAPLDGSAPAVVRNLDLAPDPTGRAEPGVHAFSLDPRGRFLVYRAEQDEFGVPELYAAYLRKTVRRSP